MAKPKYVCNCQAAFGGEVVHCPRHAAADEMYEALRDSVTALGYMDKHNREDYINWEQRYNSAKAAIALADGEKDGG